MTARHFRHVTCCIIGVCVSLGNAISGDAHKEGKVSAEAASKRLKQGNVRFVRDQSRPRAPYSVQRAKLAGGQQPFAVVLTCADSRVSPEIIFNQQLGDLFVIRVAGNVTSPEVLGSVEYAVEHLGTTLVVVLGHTSCGAVGAALADEKPHGNLGELIAQVHTGNKDPKPSVAAAVRDNVAWHAEAMSKKSPIIKDFVDSKRIRVSGAVYSLKTGKVEWLGSDR